MLLIPTLWQVHLIDKANVRFYSDEGCFYKLGFLRQFCNSARYWLSVSFKLLHASILICNKTLYSLPVPLIDFKNKISTNVRYFKFWWNMNWIISMTKNTKTWLSKTVVKFSGTEKREFCILIRILKGWKSRINPLWLFLNWITFVNL